MADRCDGCSLHEYVTRDIEKACTKIAKVEADTKHNIERLETNILQCKKEDHTAMWDAIDKKLPRWAFVMAIGLTTLAFSGFGGVIASLYNSQEAIQATNTQFVKTSERSDAIISTELAHIKDAIKDIQRSQRRNSRNNPSTYGITREDGHENSTNH